MQVRYLQYRKKVLRYDCNGMFRKKRRRNRKGYRKMKLALIGAGSRGMIYARYAFHNKGIGIAAVVEPNEERRRIAAQEFHVEPDMQFDNAGDFFRKGKLCEVAVIASMDRDHFEETMEALEAGYDILLEKPISPDPKECIRIQQKADTLGRQVTICHVLRYTNFFSKIKEIIDSGQIGKIVTIDHSENIGNFHMAHSFVRGNWRNSDLSSPLIMQKSCHDMDILVWLTGSDARTVSSFGSLTYFREENAPEGSADRCLECPAAKNCRFDARKQYLPVAGVWPANVITPSASEEDILKGLEKGPYGRCVYRCDNNVCDHQVSIIEFENGVTATFNLSGFTNKIHRVIHIMCEDGELWGDDETNTITVTRFSSNDDAEYEALTVFPGRTAGGHGGGDTGLMEDFIGGLHNPGVKDSRSAISRSIESHLMAYAAEQSRITGKTVVMKELKESLA